MKKTVLLFPEIHIMNINLPALYAIHMLKLPFVNLQNASLFIMVLHTCSLLSKERTVQQKAMEPFLWNSLVLTMFSTNLKHVT